MGAAIKLRKEVIKNTSTKPTEQKDDIYRQANLGSKGWIIPIITFLCIFLDSLPEVNDSLNVVVDVFAGDSVEQQPAAELLHHHRLDPCPAS